MNTTMKRIALSALMLIVGTASAECVLRPAQVTGEKLIGSYSIEKVTVSGVQFSQEHGDLTKDSRFNLDTLYELRGSGETARLRFADTYFVKGSSFLGNAQWENDNHSISPGDHEIYAIETKQKTEGQTITMVGDSITWWSAGKNFRCLLSDKLKGASFVGPHTDAFGYGHAGEGGNKTTDVIERLDKIQKSDFYIMHIGTNDWPVGDASFSFRNIKKIAGELSSKGGKVLILTILPRLDDHDQRNREINEMLRAWAGKGCNCKLIDFEGEFRGIENPKSLYWDIGLHPNLLGYQKIVDILAPKISQELRSSK